MGTRFVVAICLALFMTVTAWGVTALADTTPNQQELISFFEQGAALAADAVVSGKGIVNYRYRSVSETGYVSEKIATYTVAFSRDRWRISVEGTSLLSNESFPGSGQIISAGVPTTFHWEFAADANTVIFYLPDEKMAYIVDPGSDIESFPATAFQSAKGNVTMIGKGMGAIRHQVDSWACTGWRLIGQKTVNGIDYQQLEGTTTPVNATGALEGLSLVSKLCLAPDNGFMWPEVMVLITSPRVGNDVLVQHNTTEPRMYADNLWGPGKHSEKQYSSKGEITMSTSVEYGPDFQLNVPITESELKLTLPSGTEVNDEILDEIYTTP